jgi:pantothenate kinase
VQHERMYFVEVRTCRTRVVLIGSTRAGKSTTANLVSEAVFRCTNIPIKILTLTIACIGVGCNCAS